MQKRFFHAYVSYCTSRVERQDQHATLRSAHNQETRPIPGLGNIALSLVSSVVTAIVSRRVLQVENWTAAAHTFGPPLPSLLLETSGWAPHIDRLQAAGQSVDSFAAHDGGSGFAALCGLDLSLAPPARLWRIFSNQARPQYIVLCPFL